jgi:hypothetical protein
MGVREWGNGRDASRFQWSAGRCLRDSRAPTDARKRVPTACRKRPPIAARKRAPTDSRGRVAASTTDRHGEGQ